MSESALMSELEFEAVGPTTAILKELRAVSARGTSAEDPFSPSAIEDARAPW